jgi:hypothetical protein
MYNSGLFAAMAKRYSLKAATAGAILKGFPPSNTISPGLYLPPIYGYEWKELKPEDSVLLRKLNEWYRRQGIDMEG